MREKLRKFIEVKPVVVEGEPDAHNVILRVTNQSFNVTPYACDTKEDAEWVADQLCVALERLVREVT